MPRVLYLRADLLPSSETFIAAQARALQKFEAGFAGLKQLSGGLEAPQLVATVGNRSALGRGAQMVYRWTGRSGQLERRTKEWRPDLLHAHFAVDACLFLPLAERLGKPFAVTLHGYDAGSTDEAHARTWLGRIYLRRREALWQRADAFLCVSEHLRKVALERGFPEQKLRVHYTGVGVRAQEERISATEPLVLFVGRLIEKKGCRFLLEAMEKIERRVPDARLIVIGEGRLRAKLEAVAGRRLRRCTFLGAQPNAVVRHWMGQARVLAVPSIRAGDGDCEGLTTVILEAMERALPVVAFDGCGADEAIVAGETGYLAPSGDIAALEGVLLRLLGDSEHAREMGKRGRRRVEQRFDLAQQTKRLEDYYDEWIGRHAR
jgi:glycosyltransferase involved in cell wall biosynthesis